MKSRFSPRWIGVLWLPLCSATWCAPPQGAAGAASAATPAGLASTSDAPRVIYQQRGADGRVLLTDRPVAGVPTQRRWAVEPEDAQAAAARLEASRARSEQVTERIQRSIEVQQQQHNALLAEQLRWQTADALRAEREREREHDWAAQRYRGRYSPDYATEPGHWRPQPPYRHRHYPPNAELDRWPEQPRVGETAVRPPPPPLAPGVNMRPRPPQPN